MGRGKIELKKIESTSNRQVNGLSALEISTLKHWCDDIFKMRHLFPLVTFNHIYREHNMLADSLSKLALNMRWDMDTSLNPWMGRLLKKAKFLFFDGCIYYLMVVYTICNIMMFMYIFFSLCG